MITLLLSLALCASVSAHAIMPLPYSTEPEEQENEEMAAAWDPKSVKGYQDLYEGRHSREMELPDFGAQPAAVGYDANETFVVPAELKPRVDFWKKIYTQYTTSQAVLHDMENMDIVYGVVDISEIMTDQVMPYRKKMRLLNKLLKAEKKKIADALKLLDSRRQDPLNIPVEHAALFRRFQNDPNPHKFSQAAERVRAQIGQRDVITQGFLYGGRYFPRLMEIFHQAGVPKELTRLPLVESGFNLGARSKVGASGVWQFMRSTAKLFMRVDRFVDERNDPIIAAWSAAALLRKNYERLQSWPLAITAYNHGPEGMARAVAATGTRHLPTIIKNYNSRTFGFASSNFYSEFLAILEIEREYREHFGKMLVDAPLLFEEFNIGDNYRFVEVAEACRLNSSQLAGLNPALTDFVTSGKGYVPQGFRLKVPVGKLVDCRSGSRNLSRVSVKEFFKSPKRRLAMVKKFKGKKARFAKAKYAQNSKKKLRKRL